MTTATQQLTRFLEACVWQLRPGMWLALEQLAGGFFIIYFIWGDGSRVLLGFGVATFTWIGVAYLGRRYLPFSERLRHRWQIDAEPGRRSYSNHLRQKIWWGIGMAVGVLVTGAPLGIVTLALASLVLGLISAYQLKQLGIDE